MRSVLSCLVSVSLAACSQDSRNESVVVENIQSLDVSDCTPGQNQTCNADEAVSALWGTCKADATCECATGFELNATGQCQPSAAACDTTKLRFTQQDGCLNDGSVEFCLPNDRPDVVAAAKAIESSLQAVGSGGRAKCDLSSETLYLFPTPSDDASVCTERHGALTAEAWDKICQLTAIPEIRVLVPTWYE